MRCFFYCTASEYKMELLAKHFDSQKLKYRYFDDVIYAQMYDAKVDTFIFPFGCVIFWGEEDDQKTLLKELKKFEVESTTEIISDFIHFSHHKKIKDNDPSNSFIEEEENRIVLGSKSEYLKLSISYALAQSAKLSFLEISVSKMLNSTTIIQKELAKTGGIALSQKEISKKIGKLFSQRFSNSP